MTPLLFVATALLGGVGAALRFLLDGLVRARTRGTFPIGTALVNLSGSFALGIATGVAAGGWLAPEVTAALGVGLFGGYTTFSTASVETVRLAQERRYRAAVVNGLGVVVSCTLAALAGLWLGGLLGGMLGTSGA
ncbi:putative fluoride ion transporter CrcB [Agromyces sp. NDB4Y10]|uniref:fluoride efflux transporter CrcB n=1 Tax=Agromyces sp. NDB4Y10 TaxID=1775951 RepID=UPI0007B1A80C|nr:fluoride efflux transporter CrcB [Agromyces sp. NDB4Y10]KZE92696.1 putative fluoride ion transporter CrcB [Agromyces sp. NDB4Y10]